MPWLIDVGNSITNSLLYDNKRTVERIRLLPRPSVHVVYILLTATVPGTSD